MGSFSKNTKDNARRVTIGGLFSALSLVCMLLSNILPFAMLSAPILAAMCLVPVYEELGAKYSLLAYIVVSILSFTMVADIEANMMFVLLMGYYPSLKPQIERIKLKIVQYICKCSIYTVSMLLSYFLILKIFVSPAVVEEFATYSQIFVVGLMLLGMATFLLFDMLISKVIIIYNIRIKKRK